MGTENNNHSERTTGTGAHQLIEQELVNNQRQVKLIRTIRGRWTQMNQGIKKKKVK